MLSRLGFNLVTLANNHLKDYGPKGVLETIDSLEQHHISHVGAGENLESAKVPFIFEKDGTSVAIINICENESSIAKTNEAGAAPIDLLDLYYRIPALKKTVDYVIAITHGGCEHYQLPTPEMKRRFHYIADLGADVIINHHQHCFSGYETYNGTPIFYGLGNFFFDNDTKRNCPWNYGYMLKLHIGTTIKWEIVPYEQCNVNPDLKIIPFGQISESIDSLNKIIVDDEKLEEKFDKMISARKQPLSPFVPYSNHYLKALYHRGLFPSFLSKKRLAQILNSISCETHREVFLHFMNHNE